MIHLFKFQHKYWPVAVVHMKDQPTTSITLMCGCGKSKVKIVDGEWTLDDVKAKVVEKIADKLKI